MKTTTTTMMGNTPRTSRSRLTVTCLLLLLVGSISFATAQNNSTHFLDRFTYEDETIDRGDGFFDYRPRDWNEIKCTERNRETLAQCAGYPDKWHEGINWTIQRNYCRWCPESEADSQPCSSGFDSTGSEIRHHQSPIDLKREYGLEPGTHVNARECIDLHWMKYEDSTCSLEELIEADAFTIERHGLRVSQPITVFDNLEDDTDGVKDGVRLNCRTPGIGSRFGRIDFSKGFAHWWHLSHMDLHVPSEHTQEGKRYDAELQMYHFYSIDYDNEMAAVTLFLEAYDDAPPYKYLDKVICQWRRKEYETRQQCGLDPIPSSYPGCFPLTRDRERNLLRREDEVPPKDSGNDGSVDKKDANKPVRSEHQPLFKNIADVIFYNDARHDDPEDQVRPLVSVEMDEANFADADEKDWDAWIAEQSSKMQEEEALYHKLKDTEFGGDHNSEDLHEKYRRLIQGDELEWFNYWPMLGCRTEYYFRYQGSQTIPPCYGNVIRGSRRGTNHWRILKDPVRIHPRQLVELNRLIRERIAPPNDPVMPCQPDTAAKVDEETGAVDTARPKQYIFPEGHLKTFCECKDWGSKWPEDREWCRKFQDNIEERFYEHPYNFESDGFDYANDVIPVEPNNGK